MERETIRKKGLNKPQRFNLEELENLFDKGKVEP